MPAVPSTIDRAALRAAFESLGIPTDHLREIRADVHEVELVYLALNDAGRRYLTDGAVTEIRYTVKVGNTDVTD